MVFFNVLFCRLFVCVDFFSFFFSSFWCKKKCLCSLVCQSDTSEEKKAQQRKKNDKLLFCVEMMILRRTTFTQERVVRAAAAAAVAAAATAAAAHDAFLFNSGTTRTTETISISSPTQFATHHRRHHHPRSNNTNTNNDNNKNNNGFLLPGRLPSYFLLSHASCLEKEGGRGRRDAQKKMPSSLTKEERENMEDVEVHIEGEEEEQTTTKTNGKSKKGRHTAQWRVYTDLGREKFLAGDIEFALKCFERALKEAKLGFGEKDAHVAAALNNLAELARTQRMWEKAEGLYKECLDLLRELKETTPNSSSSSSSSDSSSKVDKRKGAEYKAEATIAAALHNLASCMLQNNKPKEAYENYRTSLNLKQVVFENENHPEIALTLHHMAEALLLLERIEDAIVVLERSVKITDAVGIGHTPTAFRRMRRLCQLYEIKKRFDDVDAMKKRIETQFSKQV